MKIKLAILLLLCSQMTLAGNNCLSLISLKRVECTGKSLFDDFSALRLEFDKAWTPLKVNEASVEFGIMSFSKDYNNYPLTDIDFQFTNELNAMSLTNYTPIEHIASDIKFNIVYEFMISVTYEPWSQLWVIDHFMFEYITDKYQNAFAMFTIKIDIL